MISKGYPNLIIAGFRSELYAQAYCRISSYLQTMANQGINPLIAIQMHLVGKIDSMRGVVIINALIPD